MDSSTGKLIHVGSEVIILAGLTFYLNKQIGSLRAEIRELRAKSEEDAREVNKHINNMYMVIDHLRKAQAMSQMYGSMDEPGAMHWMNTHKPAHAKKNDQAEPAKGMELRQRKPKNAAVNPDKVHVHASKTHQSKHVAFQPLDDDDDAAQPEDRLDEELKDELQAIEDDDEIPELTDDVDDSQNEVKETEPTGTDLSFVQSAIRPVARKPLNQSSQKK